jgi:hypothetical protein
MRPLTGKPVNAPNYTIPAPVTMASAWIKTGPPDFYIFWANNAPLPQPQQGNPSTGPGNPVAIPDPANRGATLNVTATITLEISSKGTKRYTVSLPAAVDLLNAMLAKREDGYNKTTYVTGITTEAQKKMADKAAEIYPNAKQDLCNTTGEFCAFCEIAGSGRDFDIEHKVPKDPFPTEMLSWGNFVLSCKTCNSSAKGVNPSRVYGISRAVWQRANPNPKATDDALQVPNPTPPPPNISCTYNAIRDAARDYCFWPDVGGRSFQVYGYQLMTFNNGAAQPVAMNIATHPNTRIATQNNNQVTAVLFDPVNQTLSAPTRVEVHMVPRPATGAVNRPDVEYGRDETLDMLKLNQVIAANGGHSVDERIYKRTLTWFKAIRKFKTYMDSWQALTLWTGITAYNTVAQSYNAPSSRLKALAQRLVSSAPNQLTTWDVDQLTLQTLVRMLSDGQLDDICELVEATGFYSVWVTVARAYSLNFAQRLVQQLQTRAQNSQSPTHFQGTLNTDVLPYL